MYTFKANSSKSNAKRFLVNTAKLADFEPYLTQDGDGNWGTYLKDGAPVPVAEVTANMQSKIAALAAEVNSIGAPQQPADEDEPATGPSASAFGSFALTQLTAVTNNTQPAGETERNDSTGLKIEKNRPERNGVTRPSVGTICARVWDLSDSMTKQQGSTVAFSDLVDAAMKTGINQYTARTQYALWRRFNGITGFIKKQR